MTTDKQSLSGPAFDWPFTGLPRDLQAFIMGKVDVEEHLKALTVHLSVEQLRRLYGFVSRQIIANKKAEFLSAVGVGDRVEVQWMRDGKTNSRGMVANVMANRFLFKLDKCDCWSYTNEWLNTINGLNTLKCRYQRRQVRYDEVEAVRKLPSS